MLSHTKAAHYSFLTAFTPLDKRLIIDGIYLTGQETTLKKSYKELLTTQEAHSKKPLHSAMSMPLRVHYTKAINMALIFPSSGLRYIHAYARKNRGKLFNIM